MAQSILHFTKYLLNIICILKILTIFLPLCSSVEKFESEFFDSPEITVKLSHSFGVNSDEHFTPRGSVIIHNFKGPKFSFDQKELTREELNSLKALGNKDDFYYLKATVKSGSTEKTFQTFSPAKLLYDSGLSDVVSLHLSPNSEIISVSYSMSKSGPSSFSLAFNSTITVQQGELGPMPDTGPFLEKLEMERLAKERGDDVKDNRSFLAKYWMYIVPVLLIVLLSGASNSEGEGGGGR